MLRMESLMRNYVSRKNMDRDIENTVKACNGCALTAKAPPIKLSLLPNTNRPWSRIHIYFAGPLDGFDYQTVVDSFSKWPEMFICKKATTEVVTSFLHKLFARFGVVDCIVSDNGSKFMSYEFKEFRRTFSVEHMIGQYHPRSNGQAKRFVDKRALRKARDTPTDKAIQWFLQAYRVTPNKNAPSAMVPAEVIFTRKIQSVFDKLLPNQSKLWWWDVIWLFQ